MKVTILWRGDMGSPPSHYARTVVNGVTDSAAALAMGTALIDHTKCNLGKRSESTLTIVNDIPPEGTPPVNVDRRGIVYFQNPVDFAVKRLTLPSPADADIEDAEGGERYTSVAGTAIVGIINTATGASYNFLWGKVIQVT
jgi:hypothetical protein